ncbi:STAS domain-containing protein [Bosea sp. (in: a-proteobacteria)]|uniref:STAS domain-containing protein n=1 Tax=Bosea sp. (in: a-proteobacteria) TaxID=1871050 RepID=UPI001228DFBC|nr:STAS domain-containing protein [Bosea sp. (in: a-proteobacteria)]TAJ28801.1 MAG: STAS domain-containing protein [Bosea sp. (in: a-proteobacteria)]
MGEPKTHPTEAAALVLPQDCTVRTIAALAGTAREAFAAGAGLALDGSRVENADITLVQLVVSAQRSFEALSVPFALVDPSPAVLSAFSRAGVAAPQTASLPSGAH